MTTLKCADPQLNRFCPVCGQNAPNPCWKKADFEVIRCRACSMLYVNPVGADLASGVFYARRPFYVSSEKLEGDYAAVRFERELRVFREWCKAGTVLDVGCSTGAFLHQLTSRYPDIYEVLGIDVPGPALDYAQRRKVSVCQENFLDLDVTGRRFDAITFWAVMEHLVEPAKFLNKAAQALKPGGHCFLLVPNARSLAVRLLGPKYRYIMAEHLNYFTAATLKAFAQRAAELEIVEAGSSHFNPLVIAQDFWSKGKTVSDAERARLLQQTTRWKQNPLLRPLKWTYACVEGMLSSLGLADNLYLVLEKRSEHA